MKQSTKDWIQYSTAIAMVASAIVIAFLAFIITSTIESGVLIYIAQALCYAGGIFGVSIYFKNKMGEFESNAKEQIEHMVNDIMHKNT
jgi:hypothetical protein